MGRSDSICRVQSLKMTCADPQEGQLAWTTVREKRVQDGAGKVGRNWIR